MKSGRLSALNNNQAIYDIHPILFILTYPMSLNLGLFFRNLEKFPLNEKQNFTARLLACIIFTHTFAYLL